MKKLIEHLKQRLKFISNPEIARRANNLNNNHTEFSSKCETPLRFLTTLTSSTSLQKKPLGFAYDRLASLLRTIEVSNLQEFNDLTKVADFASLLATYSEGIAKFAVIIDNASSIKGVIEPRLQLACLDSSLAISEVFKTYRSVVITSGTLSPIDLYPKLLQFEPKVSEQLNMSTFRSCIRPLIVTRGSDQAQINTKYENREDQSIVTNYGHLLVKLCSTVPDGVVAFFTSYRYLEQTIIFWDAQGILKKLTEKKLVFIETKDVMETSIALTNYKKACDSGKGGLFLSVARGKVSEGINFDRHYGRCVVLFGVPFQYTQSHTLRARMEYLRTHYQIREADFLNFDAIRQASQCVGRVIRSKVDYGLMVFADSRYARSDKLKKLPKWILQFMDDDYTNCSTDDCIMFTREFLRSMSQPIDKEKLQQVFFDIPEGGGEDGNGEGNIEEGGFIRPLGEVNNKNSNNNMMEVDNE